MFLNNAAIDSLLGATQMKFQVPITYRGECSFIVEADNPEQAKDKAESAFRDGTQPPDILGNEWEEIERVATPIPIK